MKTTQTLASSPVNEVQEETIDEGDHKADLIMQLGRALLSLGSPAHRLEAALDLVCRELGVSGQFFSTPTGLFASVGTGKNQRTVMIRANPGEVDLGKLSDINDTLQQLSNSEISLRQAADTIQAIYESPSRFGSWATVIAFALTSTAVATLFSGGWPEIIAGTATGTLIGLLAILSGRFITIARVFEPLAATLAAFIGWLFASYSGANAPLIIMAGLIVLIPGLGVTVAVRELATGQLVAGSSRLAGAITLFLILGFGVAVGTQLASWILGELIFQSANPAPGWMAHAALLPITAGLTVLFRAHVRDAVWIFLACIISLESINYLVAHLGSHIGAALAAMIVTISGNVFSRFSGRPSMILHIPGLMLLVPGSVGFRGLTDILNNDFISGLQTTFNAGLVAVALTTGMLMASILVPPRREL